jgi:Ca2+-binding RTX toxin-like protein
MAEFLGGDGADTLTGGAENDRLEGRGGDDLLIGNGGADVLIGGDGNDRIRITALAEADVITLGAGSDTVEFAPSAGIGAGAAVVTDFQAGPAGTGSTRSRCLRRRSPTSRRARTRSRPVTSGSCRAAPTR